MTLILRPYQEEAIEALFDYWSEEPGNPLIDLATGTGKALLAATIIKRLVEGYADMRVACITHVEELISQNYAELLNIWPWPPAGIYSASLGRREAHAQILFGGIQTVHNKTAEIGHIDVIIIDEAHLISPDGATMYGQFIAACRAINPDLKLVGLTATPYRLGTGRLDEGEGKLFDRVVYTYGIGDAIRDGYLAPLVSKATATGFDLTGVGTTGGDWKKNALAAAVDKYDTTRAAIKEVVQFGKARRTWLGFCAGVEHAEHVRDAIRAHGYSCEVVTGKTPKGERRKIISDLRAGKLRAVTNDAVLVTGVNVPGVDLIFDLAPTKSTSRFVQKAGRGTRPVYAPGAALDTVEQRIAAIAGGPKPNCLYLDFAGNVKYHGPVDTVQPRKPGSGTGEAPIKTCPECFSIVHASVMTCRDCGYVFPPNEEEKITATAAAAPILSSVSAEWVPVARRAFKYHDKVGGTPSVRVEFSGTSGAIYKMWICPQHTGFPKKTSDRFWRDHGGTMPPPASVDEFLSRGGDLGDTGQISIRPQGRYWNVTAWRAGAAPAANDNAGAPANDNLAMRAAASWGADLDDDIPF